MPFAPSLLIHPSSRTVLESFVREPNHAVLLHGNPGVGLTTIAKALSDSINPDRPYTLVETIDGKDISIDQVRPLYSATQSVEKTGNVVIIDDMHTMSIPAQNAFLKLLEEPPAHVHFILVVHDLNAILPTIHSRATVIEIRSVAQNDMRAFIAQLTPEPTLQAQLGFLANGSPAIAQRLVDDDQIMSETADMTRDARSFIQSDSYDRLLLADKYAKQRESATQFVTMLGQLLMYGSRKQPDQSFKLGNIATVIDNLHDNANVKLQLIHLALSL